MCVQVQRNGQLYLLEMSADKVNIKAGDFGNHVGLKLNYVSS